jgi:hypothetical protein
MKKGNKGENIKKTRYMIGRNLKRRKGTENSRDGGKG